MKISKRIFCLILVMALLLSAVPMGAAATGNVKLGIALTKANLRLRSEANTSSTALTTVSKGEVVLVLSEATQDWYKVSYNGQEGYMSGTYLDVKTTGDAELGYGTINASKVNLRKGPGTSHSIVAVGNKGNSAYVVGIENGWYRVNFNSNECYIRSDFLDLTSDVPTAGNTSSNNATSSNANSSSSDTASTESASTEKVYGIAFTTGSGLRLRSTASTSGNTLASASKGEVVVVLEKSGNWCKVIYNLKEGYMHADYLNIKTTGNAELGYGTINANSVNLRSSAGTSGSKVAVGNKGAKAYIIGVENGWYQVIFSGKICFIRSDFLDLTQIPYENKGSSNSPIFYRGGKSTGVAVSASALTGTSGNSSSSSSSSASTAKPSGSVTGNQIVETAKKYLGVPYVYGGTTPSGFDCSGLVYYVLKSHGITVSRSSAAMYSCGKPISKSELQPGDLVFFHGSSSSTINHVGIYVGNNQFIHSPQTGRVVCIESMNSTYRIEHYYGAIRVI